MLTNFAGWDVGGAHLKAVFIEPETKRLTGYQQLCELWKGLDQLENAVQQILAQFPSAPKQHAVTMTGELVDLFGSRDEGVASIIAVMERLLPVNRLVIYAGKDGFLKPAQVNKAHYASIASANWLASATWAATKVNNGLFVDIGSTTTDILLLQDAQVNHKGYSDYERLVSQELVYTGVIRTPVMAIAQFAEDQGRRVGLMAEYFATMADVYRLTGDLNESHDQSPTADGGAKTVSASAKRLARMIGCDYLETELPRWRLLAENLQEQQLAKLQAACLCRLEHAEIGQLAPLVGAGVGRFLVKRLAVRLDRPYVDFTGLLSGFRCRGDYDSADCAPAAAIALLYAGLIQEGEF